MDHIHALELPPVSDVEYEPRRTVVVGYDGSASSDAALRYARRRAGKVVLVNACAPRASWFGVPSYHGGSVPVSLARDVEFRTGPPARVLLDAAHDHHADEIVIGARGSRAAGCGSVGRALLDSADVPVVVVPQRRR